MHAVRMLIVVGVVCAYGASLEAAQRAGVGRGSGRVSPPPRAVVPAPKTDRPAPPPRTDHTIAGNIAKDPKVEARVKAMLPPGMTIEEASDGFRNQGQFIAALQASKNLDLDFANLKAEMTGPGRLTLGEAIQKLKP